MRHINDLTWDMLNAICSDHEVLEGLINEIAFLDPFSDHMEEVMIEFIDEAVQCKVIIPPNNYWDPKEIDWTGVQYGLLKAYQHVFDQVKFDAKFSIAHSPRWKRKLDADFGDW